MNDFIRQCFNNLCTHCEHKQSQKASRQRVLSIESLRDEVTSTPSDEHRPMHCASVFIVDCDKGCFISRKVCCLCSRSLMNISQSAGALMTYTKKNIIVELKENFSIGKVSSAFLFFCSRWELKTKFVNRFIFREIFPETDNLKTLERVWHRR